MEKVATENGFSEVSSHNIKMYKCDKCGHFSCTESDIFDHAELHQVCGGYAYDKLSDAAFSLGEDIFTQMEVASIAEGGEKEKSSKAIAKAVRELYSQMHGLNHIATTLIQELENA